MTIQKPSKFRSALLATITLLSIGLPLSGLLHGSPAVARSVAQSSLKVKKMMKHRKTVTPPTIPKPPIAPAITNPPVNQGQLTTPILMESYSFIYTYNNPLAFGQPVTESYRGTGFAPAGTFTNLPIKPVLDGNLNSIGSYTIGNVKDNVPYDAMRIGTVTVSEYDINGIRNLLNGAGGKGTGTVNPNLSKGGLGNEQATLTPSNTTFVYGFNDLTPALPSKVPHS